MWFFRVQHKEGAFRNHRGGALLRNDAGTLIDDSHTETAMRMSRKSVFYAISPHDVHRLRVGNRVKPDYLVVVLHRRRID